MYLGDPMSRHWYKHWMCLRNYSRNLYFPYAEYLNETGYLDLCRKEAHGEIHLRWMDQVEKNQLRIACVYRLSLFLL